MLLYLHFFVVVFVNFLIIRCYPLNTVIADADVLDKRLREYTRKYKCSKDSADENGEDDDDVGNKGTDSDSSNTDSSSDSSSDDESLVSFLFNWYSINLIFLFLI